MMSNQFSRVTYKQSHSHKVAKYYHPSYKTYDIVCDLCKKVLYLSLTPSGNDLRLYTTPVEEQKGVNFYSVVEGDQSIQYCKTCIKIIQIAPL